MSPATPSHKDSTVNALRTAAWKMCCWPSSMASRAFQKAILAVFPDAQIQTCIVHLLRNSLAFVSYGKPSQLS
jgi:transposase-like protein